MKRMAFPLLSKISLILSGILFALYLLIEFLELQNIYIYISGVGAKEIIPFITIPCVALLISAGAIFLFQNCKSIILKILVVLLALVVFCVVIYFIIFGLFFSPENTYYEFTSDDQQHTIIVKEESWLQSMGCKFYEKTSFCTMEEVGTSGTHNLPYPLTSEKVLFVWNEDSFELHFGEEVIEMAYVK